MDEKKTQLLIIGGGPGGYTAAFEAAAKGINVVLVDPKETPGGVCLYQGCIPSKALLHSAKILTDAHEAKDIGINFNEPETNIEQLRNWKNSVITKLGKGLMMLFNQCGNPETGRFTTQHRF